MSLLLLPDKLFQNLDTQPTHTYYLTGSVGQGLQVSLAECSDSVPADCSQSTGWGPESHLKIRLGKNGLPVPLVCRD